MQPLWLTQPHMPAACLPACVRACVQLTARLAFFGRAHDGPYCTPSVSLSYYLTLSIRFVIDTHGLTFTTVLVRVR